MSYGVSRSQMARMTSIASANILLRSWSRLPSASASHAQRAGADAEDEAAAREVVEHRGVRGDQHRMHLRQVGRAGRELDRLRVADERREEQHAARDVLGLLGQVLADERVVKAEPVREDDRLAVLLQRLGGAALHGMERHGEVAEAHAEISRIESAEADDTQDPSRVDQPREETVCPIFQVAKTTDAALRGSPASGRLPRRRPGARGARLRALARPVRRGQARDLDQEVDHHAQLARHVPGRRIDDADRPSLDRVFLQHLLHGADGEIVPHRPPVRLRRCRARAARLRAGRRRR